MGNGRWRNKKSGGRGLPYSWEAAWESGVVIIEEGWTGLGGKSGVSLQRSGIGLGKPQARHFQKVIPESHPPMWVNMGTRRCVKTMSLDTQTVPEVSAIKGYGLVISAELMQCHEIGTAAQLRQCPPHKREWKEGPPLYYLRTQARKYHPTRDGSVKTTNAFPTRKADEKQQCLSLGLQ